MKFLILIALLVAGVSHADDSSSCASCSDDAKVSHRPDDQGSQVSVPNCKDASPSENPGAGTDGKKSDDTGTKQ